MKLTTATCLTLLLFCPCLLTAEDWFRGGTLSGKGLGAWVSATDQDRLASAAELLAVAKAVDDMSQLRQRSEQLVVCVSGRAKRAPVTLRLTRVAHECMRLLNFTDPQALNRLQARYPEPVKRSAQLEERPAPEVSPTTFYNIPAFVGLWRTTEPQTYGEHYKIAARVDGTLTMDFGRLGSAQLDWQRMGDKCFVSTGSVDHGELWMVDGSTMQSMTLENGSLRVFRTYKGVGSQSKELSASPPPPRTAEWTVIPQDCNSPS